MAYGTYDKDIHVFQDATTALDDVHTLQVGAADLGLAFDVIEPITVTRIGVIATVTYDYATQTAEANVSVDRRIAYGDDTGRVELGVIKQLDATPAGTVIKLDINPVDLDVGDQVVLEAKVAGTGGGGLAGEWKGFFCYHHRAEVTGNQSEQTDTA